MTTAPQHHREMTATVAAPVPATVADLDDSTYAVLRARLQARADELARRGAQLNDRRIEGFGGIEMTLLGTEYIRTEHNCVPRDVVALADGRMVFGYNVFLGLQPETEVGDVFAVQPIPWHRCGIRLHAGQSGGAAEQRSVPARLRRVVSVLPPDPAAAIAAGGRAAARGVPDWSAHR
ncbi:DNA repair ATPase [Nocardia sp. NPDC051756]|uniref:DNA repair ATPase n=1 Tax=Nocardia sp. NPDC051756 TaxID=3154751 RepID=UPI00343E148C